MMNVLTRYIASRTIKGILLAFLIVTSIIMLVDFVEASRNIGADAGLNAGQVLMLTVFKTPQLIEQTIPFVVLFGVMGALYGMNRRSELIVLRASGLSAWNFLKPVIIVVLLLGLVWSLAFNPLASNATRAYEAMKTGFLGESSAASKDAIWLREGTEFEQTVIYAPKFDLINKTLYNVEFTVFETDNEGDLVFSHRFDAEKAALLPTGYWQLKKVRESRPDGTQQINQAVALPTTITAQQLQETQQNSALTPVWQLPAQITALTQAGFSSVGLKIQLHKLLSLPLTLLAMSVIAAGVSMRLTREGGALRFMLTGAAIGFGVFFIENTIKAFGEAGSITPQIAVWVIPLFVLACGLSYLSYIEDG